MSVTQVESFGKNHTRIYDGKTPFDHLPLSIEDYKQLMERSKRSNHLILCIALPDSEVRRTPN